MVFENCIPALYTIVLKIAIHMFAVNMEIFSLATGSSAPTNKGMDLSQDDGILPISNNNKEIEVKPLSTLPPPKKFERNMHKEHSHMSGDNCQQIRTTNAETLDYIKRYRSAVGREIALEEAANWSCDKQQPRHSAFKTAKLFLQLQSTK